MLVGNASVVDGDDRSVDALDEALLDGSDGGSTRGVTIGAGSGAAVEVIRGASVTFGCGAGATSGSSATRGARVEKGAGASAVSAGGGATVVCVLDVIGATGVDDRVTVVLVLLGVEYVGAAVVVVDVADGATVVVVDTLGGELLGPAGVEPGVEPGVSLVETRSRATAGPEDDGPSEVISPSVAMLDDPVVDEVVVGDVVVDDIDEVVVVLVVGVVEVVVMPFCANTIPLTRIWARF